MYIQPMARASLSEVETWLSKKANEIEAVRLQFQGVPGSESAAFIVLLHELLGALSDTQAVVRKQPGVLGRLRRKLF